MADAKRNSGGARKVAPGVPFRARREVKSEFGTPGDAAGLPEDDRGVTALPGLPSAAHEPRGLNASDVQGRVVTTPGWPTKTEQPGVVGSSPFNAKVEKAPVVSANPEEINPTLPVGSSDVDGHRAIVEPVSHPVMGRSSKELSGSDSDFDEPLSDDGSELDGFDAFLENITKELNDGLYSDLRDEPATGSLQSESASEPIDQPVVKLEPRSPRRLISTEKLQLTGALDETQSVNRSDTAEPDATPTQHSVDVISNSGGDVSDNPGGRAASVTGGLSPRQSAADCAISTEPSRPIAADQNTAQLSPPVASTTELPENTQHARKHPEAVIQMKGQSRCPLAEKVSDEASSQQPDDGNTGVPARLSSPSRTSLPSDRISEGIKTGATSTTHRSVLDDTEPPLSTSTANSSGSTSSGDDETLAESIRETSQTSAHTADKGTEELEQNVKQHQQDECNAAAHLPDRRSPREPGEIDTHDATANNITKAEIKGTEVHTQTTEDENVKHIYKHCKRTFWLLENFSEELLKEDYSSRTRSILGQAKKVRVGLDMRHDDLSVWEQLHFCHKALRSMLSALRRLSERSSKRETPRKSREDVGENKKPTEVVQPYSAAQNHIGRLPAESTSPSETPFAAQGSLSPQNEPPTDFSKANSDSIKDSGTVSNSSDRTSSIETPPSPFLSHMTEDREQTVSSRENERTDARSRTLPEETESGSVWASRPFSAPRKRMVEDGYGLSFLDNLRDRQAVNAVFSTALRRVVEKFRLVCDHSARLPGIVRKNIPESLKWQDMRSIRLKRELFTGFGVFLENVTDLQDEFLPLNPFQINLLPPKELPTSAYGGVAQKQGALHESRASPEVGLPSGEAWHPSHRFRHAYGGGAPRSSGAWEDACQHFLEKIRSKTPTKADTLNQSQCRERPPSPAAFVEVRGGGEKSSHLLHPLPFLSIVPTDSYLSHSQAADDSPPGVPRTRYLVPVPSAPAPASCTVNVPVRCNVNLEDSDMSISEGEDKSPRGTPPSLVPPVTAGDPVSDVGPERAPSRPSSHHASVASAGKKASGNRRPSSGPGTSDGRLKVNAQQAAQKILREGLNLLGQPLTTPSPSDRPSHVKRRHRNSDDGSCEAEKRSRRKPESTFPTNVKLDRLPCDRQDSKHEDPWKRFLHLSTRTSVSSTVVCPLCDGTYPKAEILSHAKSVHGIQPPGRSNSDGTAGSSTPDKPSRRATNAKISRRRSPSEDSPSRRKTSKRSRPQSPEGRSRRRTDRRPTSKERSGRSSEDDRRHPTKHRSTSRERSRDDPLPERGGEGADGKKHLSRHSSGSGGSRQGSLVEGGRDCSSPSRGSQSRVKERSVKRRSRSPHRSSHTNTKRELRDKDGKPADSVLNTHSSEISSDGSRPIESASNPHHSSVPSHPPKVPVVSPAANSAAGEEGVSVLGTLGTQAPSVDLPASHTTTEELHVSSEAKLKSRMAEVESLSKTTEGKSQPSVATQIASKQSATPEDSTIDLLLTRSGFNKDELHWQTALSKLEVMQSTVGSAACDGNVASCPDEDLAGSGTTTSKQDKRHSPVPQSKQQNVKRQELRPNLVKIQPQKAVQQSKKAKKRGSDPASEKLLMSKPKVSRSDKQAACSVSKTPQLSRQQRRKEKLLLASESIASNPDSNRAKANDQQTSDAKQTIPKPSGTPDEGARDSVEASSKPGGESTGKQKGSRKPGEGTEPTKCGGSDEAKTDSSAACSVKPGTITHRCSLCQDVLDSLPTLRKHQEACIQRLLPGNGERCPSCRQLISNQLRHWSGCRTQCARCDKTGLHKCLVKPPLRGPPPPSAQPIQPIQPVRPRPIQPMQPVRPRPVAVPQVWAGRPGQGGGGGVWCDRCEVWGHVCRLVVPQPPVWRAPRPAPVWCVHCGAWGAHHCAAYPQPPRPGVWR